MKKLLVVVDYQVDFVDGTLGFDEAKELDTYIAKKIEDYKSNNNDVIYTFDTHYENYFETEEGNNLPIKHCIKGTKGHNLYGQVGKLFDSSNDVYFEKGTFPSLELANYLRNKEYDEIEVCGLVSNICVLSNVIMIKSALPNSKIIVDRKATNSFDKKLNDYTLEVLKGIHIIVK